MNRNNAGGLLKDIRNMKRNSSLLSSSKDVLSSVKEMQKIGSTQQINSNKFMNTESKNEKIKNIDEKLEAHQSQIEKNNAIISELTNEFLRVKEQMAKQKERTLLQERKNKLLKEEIERTNKLLRGKSLKVDELIKAKEVLEKEVEVGRAASAKNEEYAKTIAILRKRIVDFEDSAHSLKAKIDEKQVEYHAIREKASQIDTLKAIIQKLNAQLSAKDSAINSYKSTVHEFSLQKDKDITQRSNMSRQIERLNVELSALKKAKSSSEKNQQAAQIRLAQITKKLAELQNQRQYNLSALKNHESEQSRTQSQLNQLKSQNSQLITKYNEKVAQLNSQSTRLQKCQQKCQQFQLTARQVKQENQKLLLAQQRFTSLKSKGNQLSKLYNTMLPQIQCPYGHQLKQPVTIIPCGHNFCLGCKKGYAKECSQCKGKLKIEAVYRNELMDDIIGIITGIKQIVEMIN